jgi:hypothetical protein
MPIIIVTLSGQQIVARGDRLTLMRRIGLWLGWPLRVQLKEADDEYTIPARSIGHILTLSDDVAEARIRAAQERAAEDQKRNPNPGPKPRLVVPR